MATAHPIDLLPLPSANEKVRKLLRLTDAQPLPVDVVDHLAWRDANVDSPDPVLRAIARAPIADEPLPADVRADVDAQLEDIRAGRATLVPHEEVMRTRGLHTA